MITNDWALQWAKYSAGKVAVEEIESGRSLTYSMLNRLSVKYVGSAVKV